MSEGQKNKSQFYTAACLGQVKCEAARKASSTPGCADSSTAGSWRGVIPALSSAVGTTGEGAAGRQSQRSQAAHSAVRQEDVRP